MTTLRMTTATLAVIVGSTTAALAVPTGFSLGNDGRTLVTMTDLGNPGNVSGVTISDNVTLNALAYRPVNGQLYGFAQNTGTVYTVDRMSGQVSSVATIDMGDSVDVGEVGFDFNNQIDAARVVSTDDDNLVFFPNNMPENITRFNSLTFNAGDVNEGDDTSVFANAYTNQVPVTDTTLQYVLDSEKNILATLDNNAGTVNTIGGISTDMGVLDFSSTGGFDIFSTMSGDGITNTGFALLTTVNGEGLYQFDSFDLGEDGYVNATFLGAVGTDFGLLDGLAVFDTDMAAVPLPAGIFLMGGAFASFAAIRRRKRAA